MAAAGMSNRFLDRPVRAMDKDEGVGANLAELRRVVEDLDPGKRGKLSGPRKILGIIPFGNKLTNYFRSYQSAQTHIQSILNNLASGKDELIMDNAAIDVEQQKLWEAMGNLEQMIHISNCSARSWRKRPPNSTRPIRPRPRRCAKPRFVLCPPAHAGFAHTDGGERAGLSRARSGEEEQC